MRLRTLSISLAASLTLITACGGSDGSAATAPVQRATPVQRTIIMVWDGLRPDSVNPVDTPNLYALQQQGVRFADNHSTYPTFTMMNGSSFATGSFPRTSGDGARVGWLSGTAWGR